MEVKMKKIKGIVLLIISAVLIVSLCSCGGKSKKTKKEDKSEAGFSINKDGTFLVTYSEDFSEDYYSEKELKQFVDEEIGEFNSTLAVEKNNGISVESLNVKKNKATLTLKFVNYEDYKSYSAEYVSSTRNADLFIGSYSEGVEKGYRFATVFKDTADGQVVNVEDIGSAEDMKVVYMNEGFDVKVEGEVVAVGTNVTYENGIIKTFDKRENYFIFK